MALHTKKRMENHSATTLVFIREIAAPAGFETGWEKKDLGLASADKGNSS
jgi:hypothetical protein